MSLLNTVWCSPIVLYSKIQMPYFGPKGGCGMAPSGCLFYFYLKNFLTRWHGDLSCLTDQGSNQQPATPVLEVQCFNHWTAGEVSLLFILDHTSPASFLMASFLAPLSLSGPHTWCSHCLEHTFPGTWLNLTPLVSAPVSPLRGSLWKPLTCGMFRMLVYGDYFIDIYIYYLKLIKTYIYIKHGKIFW